MVLSQLSYGPEREGVYPARRRLSPVTPRVCGTPVPGEVAPDLQLDAAGADLQLAWTPLSGASSYRVWRASLPDFSDERLLGTAAGPSFVQPAGMTDGTWFYRVRAVNGCEQEGP